MKFIDIPTEQTTAVTDAVLATIALVSVIYLLRFSKKIPGKSVSGCVFSVCSPWRLFLAQSFMALKFPACSRHCYGTRYIFC